MTGLAPWLSPIPTAWLVANRCVKYLLWPIPIAIISAIIIEAIGLAAAYSALTLYSYNKSKREKDPTAPLALPYAILASYLVITELLTVVIDIASKPLVTPADIAPALFPPLTLMGVLIIGTRASHYARLQQIKEQKAIAHEEYLRKKAEKETPLVSEEEIKQIETRNDFLELVKKDPSILDMSSPEIKAKFGINVCQKTVYNWTMYAKEHNGYHAEPIATK